MRKRNVLLAGILVWAGVSGLAMGCQPGFSHETTPDQTLAAELVLLPDGARPIIEVGTVQLEVELVHSPASTAQGLSGRSEIGADGMLFVLSSRPTQVPSFWMKDMQFNLDMVWIAKAEVIEITDNVPAPDPTTPVHQLPTYGPTQPANLVLELPAGQAAELGLKPGDMVGLVSNGSARPTE